MSSEFLTIATWVLPPLIGACIGYITNAIAIRMLFRPLEQKRVFGIRVPLTPGIIPRQRGQLAESIGRMVSERLLTEEVLRSKVESADFRSGLNRRIAGLSSILITSSAESAEETPTAAERSAVVREQEVVGEKAFEFAELLIERFLKSEGLETLVRSVVRHAIEGVGSTTLSDVFHNREKALASARRIIEEIVEGPVAHTVRDIVDRWLEQQTRANTEVGRFLSEEFIGEIEAIVETGYQPVFDYIIEWLKEDDIREELSYRGRIILREVLEKLNVFQRLLVSAGQYERQLRERMPAIVDDFIDSLDRTGRLPQNRRRVVSGIGTALRDLRRIGLADAQYKLDIDLRQTADATIPKLFDVLQSETVREGLVQSLDELFEKYADRPIAEILTELTGLEKDEMSQRVMVTVREWLARPGATRELSEGIISAIRRFLRESNNGVTAPLIQVEEEQKNALDSFLTDRVVALVSYRLPELVAAFNVHRLVVDRINSLDIENVERLLLMVIARHLKWINLFGALLGGLIGGLQLFLNVVL